MTSQAKLRQDIAMTYDKLTTQQKNIVRSWMESSPDFVADFLQAVNEKPLSDGFDKLDQAKRIEILKILLINLDISTRIKIFDILSGSAPKIG